MAGNRKGATEYILRNLLDMTGSEDLVDVTRAQLDALSDKEFADLMVAYEKGEDCVNIVVPNLADIDWTVERLFKLADKLGHDYFQHLWVGSPDGKSDEYLTPEKYMVLELPSRRQAQLLVKKRSIPENNKRIDNFTGQVTGDSKAAKISFPETQILRGMGLDQTLTELLKYRGGDIKGAEAMDRVMARDGKVSMASIAHLASGVESTKTLKAYLTSMHLRNTL